MLYSGPQAGETKMDSSCYFTFNYMIYQTRISLPR